MWSVLALDQSMKSTGWAHMRKGDKRPTWGTFKLPSWGDDEGQQAWEWYVWLTGLFGQYEVSHVFFEAPFEPFHHENLTEKMAQYGQPLLVCMAATEWGVDVAKVGIGQWRKPFLGSAAPPRGLIASQRRSWLKEKAKAACAARGWLVEGDDEADALGILVHGCSAIDPAFATQQGPLFRRADSVFQNEERGLK